MRKGTYEILADIRTALADLGDIRTCRIGLESNITAEDYPIIRIVPSVLRAVDKKPRTVMDLLIYYGELSHEFEQGGIEAQYEWLFDMDRKIRDALLQVDGWFAVWQETVLDEDRLPGYKLLASRFEVSDL